VTLDCKDDSTRRAEVRRSPDISGLDYLEVSSDQKRLTVYFLDKAPQSLKPGNIRLTGGRRVRGEDIRILEIEICQNQDPERDDCLNIWLDRPGDFSCYTLCLVEADPDGHPTQEPLGSFDPRYHCLEFSFKASCPSDLDCAAQAPCPPEALDEPEINYLAKDYATFRQLILDRMALLVPDWQERHLPDLGITLVEVLAYTGDYLSYYQDAVASEAYLDTARQRISVRRHARLVDYFMHQGCNARALVCVELGDKDSFELDLAKTFFITGLEDPQKGPLLGPQDLRAVPLGSYETFEPMQQAKIWLYQAHNAIHFYTWGQMGCCLPEGTTLATLKDGWLKNPNSPEPTQVGAKSISLVESPKIDPANRALKLGVGDLLVFVEICDPQTGNPADANPLHRHAVRLTRVERGLDPLYDQPILEVEWSAEDALPFPLCLSAAGPECNELEVSLARGNVVLVDHGQRVQDDLPQVPYRELPAHCEDGCPGEPVRVPGRYQPVLPKAPVVFAQALADGTAASRLLQQDPRQATPQVKLTSTSGSRTQGWQAVFDLLASGPDQAQLVLEVDDEGYGHLRFGDGELGLAPEAGAHFKAAYRIGGGSAGNVGAESIRHLVYTDALSGLSLKPRNPLPARGGTDPEPVSEVKLFAPQAFRRELRRAITPEDYATIAQREFSQVQRAVAQLVWTGSYYAMQVAVDLKGQAEAPPELLQQIAQALEPYRRIGHDLEVCPAEMVPLELELQVCVHPHYLRSQVKAGLLERLSNRSLAGGARGFFHPDNLSFGEGVYASRIVALVQAVEGVESVSIKKLQRYRVGNTLTDPTALQSGVLPLAPFQIARLDNDPSFPENGVLRLELGGGR